MMKKSSIHVIGISEKEKKLGEALFEEIMCCDLN